MLTTTRKLFWISRPVSWPNTAYPFAVGYLLTGGRVDATFIIGTLYFLISYNLAMYGVNDVYDYESDIRNPRKGGIEGMREARAFHPTILRAVAITNIPPLLYLVAVSLQAGTGQGPSGWVIALILAAVVFMMLAYSVPHLRFKERPVLDSITSSCHFVGPLVYALALTESLQGNWPYILAFFLWGMASHAFGAVQDIIPDREGGLKSIATELGAATTVRLTIALYSAASVLACLQGGAAIIIGICGLVYVANVAGYANVTDKESAVTNRAWKRFIWLNYFVGFVLTMTLLIGWYLK